MKEKVLRLVTRLKEVEELLVDPSLPADKKRYKALTQEHSYLQEVKTTWEEIEKTSHHKEENDQLLKVEKDAEFLEVLAEDQKNLQERLEKAAKKLEDLLIPPSPYDHANTILELRAGTGGDEAALFVADCVRMYQLYAAHMGWKVEPLSASNSDLGGFKECIMALSGHNVYRYLQHEGGTHRVQRVPTTEAQGRVHTSTITIAVLIEPEDDEAILINEQDLRIETTRSSGAGGQHVNKTDSAVRITHMPSGIVVFCQQERSQHKNKDKAMRLLRAKLSERERQKKKEEVDAKRLQQVGSGDRAEKVRTYNFSQNRVTDHRVNLTTYNLNQVMNGDLEEFSRALVAHERAVQLNT